MDRVVLCMKWGSLYPAEYVNVLYSACKKHISGPFRLVCLTDEADGLNDGVEAFPIPDLGLTDAMWKGGAWPKLGVYASDLYGLRGRALFIDLDMMICGSLDPFFEHPVPFASTDMSENWWPNPKHPEPPKTGTCIFAFDIGAESQIIDRFQADMEGAVRKYVIEQEWVGAAASSMDFWPAGWVISFKRFLRRPMGVDIFLGPKKPDASAKVLAFHGTPRPIDLIRRNAGWWDRFPHMGHGQVKWLAEYWEENGGQIPD